MPSTATLPASSTDVADVLEERLIDAEYKIWKKNTPYLYDFVMTHSLEWPSLTCQWLPGVKSAGEHLSQHSMLLGTHTTGEQNYVMVASVNLPKADTVIDNCAKKDNSNNKENKDANSKKSSEATLPVARFDSEKNELGGFGHAHTGAGKIEIRMKVKHEGEVNRARYMPQNHFIVATRGPNPELYIWDFSKHPSFPADDASPFAPQGVCVGHSKEGYGLAWSRHKEGLLISGSEDTTLRLWDINAAVGSKSQQGTQIKPLSVFTGHSKVVEDVDFHHRDPNMVGSVSDDRCVMLWDIREKNPSVAPHHIPNAHTGDINCISFNPLSDFTFATGSADKTVAIWDMRNLKE